MKKYVATAFMLFSLITVAETVVETHGSLSFTLDQFKEMDGNPWYSMNGEVFGQGDHKESTTDNMNDNREKSQASLDLFSDIKINEKIKLHLGFNTMVDELIGKINGSEESAVQEYSTVKDNPAITLKDITAEIATGAGKITLTNNFNYHFNSRVLTTQLDDNNGEPISYGEGLLVEKDLYGYKTKAFAFQSTYKEVDPNSGTQLTNGQNDITNSTGTGDKLIYGAEINKEYSKGKISALVIQDYDKTTEVQGDTFGKDLSNSYYSIGGELTPFEYIKFKGEFIGLSYGQDTTQVLNSFGQASWDLGYYDISGIGAKDDTNILETSAIITPTPNLEIALSYKNVGEDYIAVLGNSQRMDSWLGKASFDYSDGTGYENGYSAKISYILPIDLLTKTTLNYTDYDLTRSALNDFEDTNEKEVKGTVITSGNKWKSEASYRRKEKTNSGSGTVSETDTVYNDYNLNGEYAILNKGYLKSKVNMDLNYYTGDDNTLNQNFSNEKRVIMGSTTTYDLNKSVSLMGSYRFGYATEDNDVVHDGKAIQSLIKLGVLYKITDDIAFDLLYKYDNYRLNIDATAQEMTDSIHKKEKEHQWYDGSETWEHAGSYAWDNWPNTSIIAENYDGYNTHQFKASLTIRF